MRKIKFIGARFFDISQDEREVCRRLDGARFGRWALGTKTAHNRHSWQAKRMTGPSPFLPFFSSPGCLHGHEQEGREAAVRRKCEQPTAPRASRHSHGCLRNLFSLEVDVYRLAIAPQLNCATFSGDDVRQSSTLLVRASQRFRPSVQVGREVPGAGEDHPGIDVPRPSEESLPRGWGTRLRRGNHRPR